MRNDYKRFYALTAVPSVRTMAAYADPVRTDEERRATASRVAERQAALRRAKAGEQWIVLAVASTMAAAMLPVVVVVAIMTLASVLWRRGMKGRGRQRALVTTARSRVPRDVSSRRESCNPPGIIAKEAPHPSIAYACAA
jgi:hypothetical protein